MGPKPWTGTGAVPRRAEFAAGGLTLAADRWSARSPERGTVLLLHGGGQTRHSWDRSAAELSEAGWAAVTLDLRGHGESDWDPEGRYSIDVMALDFVAVAGQMLGARPILVGASMGGLAALLAAGGEPDLWAGLVLVDIALRIEPEGSQRVRDFMQRHPEGFADLEEAAAAVAAYNPLRRRPVRPDGLRKNLRRGEDGRWYWHWDPEILNQRHDSTDPEHPIRVRLREAARRVTVPTLLVRGMQSDVVSEAGLEEAREILPHASVAEVGDAAHMVAGDDNATFLGAVSEFLAREIGR